MFMRDENRIHVRSVRRLVPLPWIRDDFYKVLLDEEARVSVLGDLHIESIASDPVETGSLLLLCRIELEESVTVPCKIEPKHNRGDTAPHEPRLFRELLDELVDCSV